MTNENLKCAPNWQFLELNISRINRQIEMKFISFEAPDIGINHVVISLILDKNLVPKLTNENVKCAVNSPKLADFRDEYLPS